MNGLLPNELLGIECQWMVEKVFASGHIYWFTKQISFCWIAVVVLKMTNDQDSIQCKFTTKLDLTNLTKGLSTYIRLFVVSILRISKYNIFLGTVLYYLIF